MEKHAMPVIRIVATDWIAQQTESLARKEGRSLSQMGLRLLTESLDARKKSSAELDALVVALKSKAPA
jgi:hypothetical protein